MAAEGLYHQDLNQPYPDVDREVTQECSVRGCHRSIEPNGQNKMCDECRSRHRGYATTKRLRRKLEKAALQAMDVTGEAPIVPMDIQVRLLPSLTQTANWLPSLIFDRNGIRR
jgi:hypothetical protein